jgi:hypothetical protein
MAIIYSYPSATPTTADVVIGTLLSDDSGENPTKSFSIADIIGLVPAAGTGGTVTSIGLTNTDGFLTIGNSPITTAGNIGIDLFTSGGTPSATTYYRGDGQWAVPPNATQLLYTLTSVANAGNIDVTLTPATGAASIVKLIPGSGVTLGTSSSQITIGSSGVATITGSTFINVDVSAPLDPILTLSATGTPGVTNYLRGDNTWATIAAGGTMNSWNIAADTGTAEQVDEAETVTIVGGTGIDTAVAATNTVTVTNSGVTSIVAGTNVTVSGATGDVTINTPTTIVNAPNPVAAPTVAQVNQIVALTAGEYAAIAAKDANTLYIVT